MTARHSYARLVYENLEMNNLGFVQNRVWASNALDSPERTAPFIVINVDLTEKMFGTTGRDTVSYWVHQPKEIGNDYSRIDLAITQIIALMENVVHLVGDDGYSLTGGTWVDTSRDLVDEALNTIVKFVTFRTATRSLVTP